MSDDRERPPRPGAAGRLLADITVSPLDPGYRRKRDGTTPTRRSVLVTVVLLVLIAVAGLAVGAGAQQLRAARAQTTGRELLESEINRRTDLADATAVGNAGQRARIERLQAEILTAADSSLTDAVQQLGVAAGAVPVTGRGLRVTMDDAPDADELFADAQTQDQGRVLDVDISQVVNGLWAGGAEAVAVNGQRLTSISAIRGAGSAILVDDRPLARPYVIEAIGDATAMRAELTTGVSSTFVSVLQDNFGIGVSVADADDLRLPGSSSTTLRHARTYRDAPTAATTTTSDAE